MRIAISILIIFSLSANGDSCAEWFKKSKLDPKSKSCLNNCLSHVTGMDTYGCPMKCHQFCEVTWGRVWIYFGNGMFNTYVEAKESAKQLQVRFNSLVTSQYPDLSELIANTSVAHVAYNQDEAIFLQLLEIYIQKMGGDAISFFRYLIDISQAPEGFRLATMKLIAKIADPGEIDDSDLRNHVNQYESHIKEGDGVIVVAHSQGNIYAMAASDHVGDDRLEINSVASPIYGSNTHTTLHSDWLIKLVPNSSRPNVRNNPEGIFDHEFIRHYLDGNKSGPMILTKTACLLSLYKKKPTPSAIELLNQMTDSPKKHQSCVDVPKEDD